MIKEAAITSENCEKEPIHTIGKIQDIGFLIVVNSDQAIVQVSTNLSKYLGEDHQSFIDRPIKEIGISGIAESLHLYNLALDNGQSTVPVVTLKNGSSFNLIIHRWQEFFILEFEPLRIDTANYSLQSYLTRAMHKIHNSPNIETLLSNTADEIREITGYERVMIYRFHSDWHGEVVAEAKTDKATSYFGLHFPASDIPQRARDLFIQNSVRIIEDVHSTAVSLFPKQIESLQEPTDLSCSILRSSSPVHIQYLKNMAVGSSLTISLLINDKLWGLIACHDSSPKFIDYKVRDACNFMGQLFSSSLQLHGLDKENNQMAKNREIGSFLSRWTLKEYNVIEGLTNKKYTVLDLLDCTGAVVCSEDNLIALGACPDQKSVNSLIDWLEENQKENIFITDELSSHYSPSEKYKDKASGIISAKLSSGLREYILWFKPEVIQTIYWGGNPEKAVTLNGADDGLKISPGKSFEKWTQIMKNKSIPWTNADISSVIKLREDVFQVLIKKANEIRKLNEKLEEAYKELDAFSYTVSHDLRTPLNAVKVYSEIMLEDKGAQMDEESREFVHKIIKNADKMSELIRAVLDYSKTGKIETHFTSINVSGILPQIVEDLKTAYREQVIEFNFSDLPVLYGDPTMVQQVFSNLISNAVKYSKKQPVSIIDITGTESESEVVYKVTDNGVGIDMKYINKIFQIFSRLTTDRAFEGNGVGMTIVQRIMERHQGKVWIESELGVGSTFYVAFPKKHQHLN